MKRLIRQQSSGIEMKGRIEPANSTAAVGGIPDNNAKCCGIHRRFTCVESRGRKDHIGVPTECRGFCCVCAYIGVYAHLLACNHTSARIFTLKPRESDEI